MWLAQYQEYLLIAEYMQAVDRPVGITLAGEVSLRGEFNSFDNE
jgi:hypothetical protein